MIYRKNLPSWERTVRILAGVMMGAAALMIFPHSLLTYILAAMGVMIVLTGFIGFCPMCSIAGRRALQKQQP